MRTLILLIVAFLSFPSVAEEIRLTLYDDGRACPGNCGYHVVFHTNMNGTQYAHLRGGHSPPFETCTSGNLCEICLESDLRQCMEVMYRGAGPSNMTFDFTPNFYAEKCPGIESYPKLQAKCKELNAGEKTLIGRINCIKNPDAAQCSGLISEARAARELDKAAYNACISQGERKFNASRPKEKQRSLGCAYEKYRTGGPNSRGTTWRRLLAAACRDGTFLGRDGLDCCNGVPFVDGPLGRECRSFYPK